MTSQAMTAVQERAKEGKLREGGRDFLVGNTKKGRIIKHRLHIHEHAYTYLEVTVCQFHDIPAKFIGFTDTKLC